LSNLISPFEGHEGDRSIDGSVSISLSSGKWAIALTRSIEVIAASDSENASTRNPSVIVKFAATMGAQSEYKKVSMSGRAPLLIYLTR
jgi:hypothetical protein